jgi:hypothetical protein
MEIWTGLGAGLLGDMTIREPTQAVRDVIAERIRQAREEGWTAEHDDFHCLGELAAAACCYAWRAHVFASSGGDADTLCATAIDVSHAAPREWPWDESWWKPKTVRRDYVRAAAMLIAEIERLDRQAARRFRDSARASASSIAAERARNAAPADVTTETLTTAHLRQAVEMLDRNVDEEGG